MAEPLGFYVEPERSAQDLGIDLVAKLRDEDGWCAIQCKFHAAGSRIAKKEIDSFLAASGHKDFRQRLIIDTTGLEWSTQAEQMLRNQAVPVRRIGLQELQASPIRWQDFATSGEIHFTEQRKLLPHQREAMGAVTSGLAELGSRGKMIMACGTGKTLTLPPHRRTARRYWRTSSLSCAELGADGADGARMGAGRQHPAALVRCVFRLASRQTQASQ